MNLTLKIWRQAGPRHTGGLVTYKVKDEVSHEFNDAPMPNSVYFTWSGHAFHQGNPNVDSAGCIHLGGSDSDAFFNQLHEGDEVFIY